MSNATLDMHRAAEREGNDVRAEDMLIVEEEPGQIEKFYNGATVFVTGATGFLGKVLIEKMLRSCPDLRRIYLLLREKKGQKPNDRFRQIFENTLFNRLRHERPDFESKLCIICGDMSLERLGINDADYETLCREVDIVMHAAATVRFDESVRVATHINVRGTAEILRLAKKMLGLRAIIHVSTAYAHCPRKEIDEKLYPAPVSSQQLFKIVDALDDTQLAAITPLLLGNFPNTYVYTKAIAEEVIATEAKGLPIAVVRPSIVISTAREPVPGWIDNLYGPTGIAVGAAVGLLRTLHCEPDNLADLVPVDNVVSAIIAAAWNVGTGEGNCESSGDPPDVQIYNYVGSTQAPICWKDFMRLTETNALKIPSPVTLWHYCFHLHPNWYIHMLAVYFLHYLPALIIDAAAILLGKKPMLMKGYKKIHKFANVISYFSSRQWTFHNENTQRLWKRLEVRDRRLFDFNMSTLSWDEYFYSYVRGMRVYLLKDPLETLPQGKIKFWKLKIAHYFLVSLICLGLMRLCWTIFNVFFT